MVHGAPFDFRGGMEVGVRYVVKRFGQVSFSFLFFFITHQMGEVFFFFLRLVTFLLLLFVCLLFLFSFCFFFFSLNSR